MNVAQQLYRCPTVPPMFTVFIKNMSNHLKKHRYLNEEISVKDGSIFKDEFGRNKDEFFFSVDKL